MGLAGHAGSQILLAMVWPILKLKHLNKHQLCYHMAILHVFSICRDLDGVNPSRMAESAGAEGSRSRVGYWRL